MRCLGITLALICLAPAWPASPDPDRPLTPEDIVSLERENGMWRAVRTDQDVPQNIQLLRRLGYQDADLAWFRPKLEEVWQLPGARSLGALNTGTREKIEEVERDFVSLYRATRRFEEAAIRPVSGPLYTKAQLNALWRKAMLRTLSYEEMKDYGLVRSEEAKRVERLTRGLSLTSIEQRELIRMAQEYGDRDTAPPRPAARASAEARLDYYAALRDLLGDDRFVVYLERANEDFLALRQNLAGSIPATAALDLFWLRVKTGIALQKGALSPQQRQRTAALAREEVAKILGPADLPAYLASEHARWLWPR